MRTTPKDALLKICPIRAAGLVAGAVIVNRQIDASVCQGPDCMMWRWQAPELKSGTPEYGYCGLAGRPDFLDGVLP